MGMTAVLLTAWLSLRNAIRIDKVYVAFNNIRQSVITENVEKRAEHYPSQNVYKRVNDAAAEKSALNDVVRL